MMTCDKCGKLMSYNSYFGAYYCSSCGNLFRTNPKNEQTQELKTGIAFTDPGENRSCARDIRKDLTDAMQRATEDSLKTLIDEIIKRGVLS